MTNRSSTIAQLRAHLAQLAPMRTQEPPISTEIPQLDTEIGGWPQPGVVSIYGAIGTGRIGVVLPTMQAHTHDDRTIAIVDPLGWLHPPGLPGINLRKLMIVRCGLERSHWAAAQLVSSGAIPVVVLLDPPPLRTNAHRLMHATESGKSTLFVLTERPETRLNPSVRIQTIGRGKLKIERGAPHQPVITL